MIDWNKYRFLNSSFWSSYRSTNSASIEELLNNQECTVEKILEDDDCLQEFKNLNDNIYKIGKTTKTIMERVKQYPKGYNCYLKEC